MTSEFLPSFLRTSVWVLIDSSAKAALLLTIAGLACLALRRASAAVRHQVWSLAFCGAVLLPVVSSIIPQWRIPLLPAPAAATQPELTNATPANDDEADDLAAVTVTETGGTSFANPPTGADWPPGREMPFRSAALDGADRGMPPAGEAESPVELATTVADPVEASLAGTDSTNVAETVAGQIIADQATTVTLLWLAGFALVMAPFAAGAIVTWRLVRRARRMTDAETAGLVESHAHRLGLSRQVSLVETECSLVPMTVGVLKPLVVLPANWRNWPPERLRFVLLHELAHVRRLDVLYQMIGRIACGLYWLNPLAWYGLHRLRIERELACDDCVLAVGETPTAYAGQLLEIARAYRPARLAVGIAMTRSSKLEQRILSLLDRARPHLPVSRAIAYCLAGSAAALVLCLSVVTLSRREMAEEDFALPVPLGDEGVLAANDKSSAAPLARSDEREELVRGRVVDSAGRPARGATVYLVWNRSSNRYSSASVLAQTTTTEDGGFQIPAPEVPKRAIGESAFLDQSLLAVAVGKGFGPDWETVEKGEPVTLKLAKDSIPVNGRVLDLEGRPIAGVRVRVRSISQTDADLDRWISNARRNPLPAGGPNGNPSSDDGGVDEPIEDGASLSPSLNLVTTGIDGEGNEMSQAVNRGNPDRRWFPQGRQLPAESLPLFSEVVTDADGRFRLMGVGIDRNVRLVLEGETIAKTDVSAITHTMKPVTMPLGDSRFRTWLYFGPTFDYVAEPTQIVTGVVREADSRKPLPDVEVSLSQFAGSLLDVEGFLSTKTDAQGRYRLVGLPKPQAGSRPARLRILPGTLHPCFQTEVDVPNTGGENTVTCDVELKRGVWVSGRVTDRETGKPVPAIVGYFPLLDNPEARKYGNFDPGLSYGNGYDACHVTTDAEGKYRIPAILGQGVVVAVGLDSQLYQAGHGADAAGWKLPDPGASEFPRFIYDLHVPNMVNSVEAVDIEDPAAETTCNIELAPLTRQTIRLRDDAGRPVSGAVIDGFLPISALHSIGFDPDERQPAIDDQAVLYGLEIDGKRLVLFFQKDRRLGKAAIVEHGKTFDVRIEPYATITGRVVDLNERPLANLSVSAVIPGSEMPESEAERDWERRGYWVQTLRTDTHGQFKFDAVVPGARYKIMADGGATADTAVVKPGESIDVGTLAIKEADPDKPKAGEKAPGSSEKSESRAPSPATDPDGSRDPKPAAPTESSPSPKSAAAVQRPPEAKPSEEATVRPAAVRTVRGRVVDVEGKPIAGAALQIPVAANKKMPSRPEFKLVTKAETDGDGRFVLEVSNDEFPFALNSLPLTAVHAGCGIEWFDIPRQGDVPSADIVLFPEQLIRGRMIDTEGRPVPRAKVSVEWLGAPRSGNSIEPFLELQKMQRPGFNAVRRLEPDALSESFAATSDADGQFVIRGIAAERVCELRITADRFETARLTVVNRPGLDAAPYNQRRRGPRAAVGRLLVGPEFVHVGAPGLAIAGRATVDGGKPVANLTVVAGPRIGPVTNTVTDADGRYRLTGLPRGFPIVVRFGLHGHDDLLPKAQTLPATTIDEEQTVDVEMKRGIFVRGRVLDPLTGKGVLSEIGYVPLRGNEYAKTAAYEGLTFNDVVDEEGTFQVAVMPGPGALLVRTYGGLIDVGGRQVSSFRLGHVSKEDEAKLKITVQPDGVRSFATHSSVMFVREASAVKYIELAQDGGPQTIDVELDRGKSIELDIVDAEGRPVAGAAILGVIEGILATRLPEPRATIYGLDGESPRKIAVLHTARGLAGSLTVTGGEPSPVRMTLGKTASIRGRAVDAAKEPIASTEYNIASEFDWLLRFENIGRPLKTDEEGRFHIENMVPGQRFSLRMQLNGRFLIARLPEEQQILKSGRELDLGDVVFAPLNQQLPPNGEPGKPAPDMDGARPSGGNKDAKPATTPRLSPPTNGGKASSGSTPTGTADVGAPGGDSLRIVHGRVTGPDGKPAMKAHVAVVGSRIQAGRGGDLPSSSEVLAEGATDEGGRFQIKLSGVSSKTHSLVQVIARSDDSGLTWRRIDPEARDTDVSFELLAEQVILGRFIDIEGQSAGAVRISINSVSQRGARENRREPLGYYEFAKPPQAWPPSVTADRNGRFEVRGIPADHGVFLNVAGNDRFAEQGVTLNSGAPEQRPERNATYRPLVRNVKPGEEAILPLAPAQIFEGVVRFADTGEPAPHARLTIFASQQEVLGSSYGLAGKADAQGRYRINPHPGVRFEITTYPPEGVPYLVRAIRDITHTDGALVKQVDVTLPRGVLVRGRIVESGTKAPIAGAMIQYVPERQKNRNATDDIITGWQAIQLSGADGAFEMAVLPGPGTLVANGPGGEFVLQEFGSRQLERGAPGGDRNYAHAWQHINPEPKSDPLEVTMELRRGASISVKLTNAAGEPVEHALLISRLFVNPSELNWRGFPKEALGGRFELSGLGEEVEYPVHFLDAKNRLGATAVFKAGDNSPTVVLLPSGQATATLTDGNGKPLAGHFPWLDLVVTPGPDRFEAAAKGVGVLAGDSAYVVNIDRTNYRPGPKTDDQGRITYPALIPGARYRIVTYEKGAAIVLKEFVAESGKTLDLGRVVMAGQGE